MGGQNNSRPKRIQDNANSIWQVLSPIICGRLHHSNDHSGSSYSGDSAASAPDLLSGRGESIHALKVMLHVLTHNPMILYAPNGTDADLVVKKVSFFFEVF